ncbi:MAG: hypothetical protein RL215_2187, partial [Planctomycetota bacterium]
MHSRVLLIPRFRCVLFTLLAALFCSTIPATVQASDEAANAAGKAPPAAPLGRFLTLPAPLTEASLAALQNTATTLRDKSAAESRTAVLVLEIPSGSSRPGLVRDTVALLTSADYSSIRFTAWISKPVSGNHAALALACHEILMHPEASLGDLGRGQSLPADDQEFYASLADRRRNPGLSRGIVLSMLNGAGGLYKVRIREAAGGERTRFLSSEELQNLRQQPVEILEATVIREAGAAAQFSAEECLRFGFLIQRTAKDRPTAAALLGLPQEALREDSTAAPRSARLIEIHGAIGNAMGDFVRREIRRARADRVSILILEIDSPGGSKEIAEDIALMLS